MDALTLATVLARHASELTALHARHMNEVVDLVSKHAAEINSPSAPAAEPAVPTGELDGSGRPRLAVGVAGHKS